tara:strand:- start:442 stop:579 length:138 start_codon:yes stop_codon:yes gene_type:complete
LDDLENEYIPQETEKDDLLLDGSFYNETCTILFSNPDDGPGFKEQ